MEDELPRGTEGTEGAEPALQLPPLPPEVSSREEELRRMVEAGAASPEELRALAAKLEERRALEHSAWRREVRPALMEAKKRRYSLGDLRVSRRGERNHALVMGVAVFFALLVLLLLASVTSFLLLLLPVLGVLVYAYVQGREQQASTPAAPDDAA